MQYITHTDTVGGQPPTPTCTTDMMDETEAIEYTAKFIFWD